MNSLSGGVCLYRSQLTQRYASKPARSRRSATRASGTRRGATRASGTRRGASRASGTRRGASRARGSRRGATRASARTSGTHLFPGLFGAAARGGGEKEIQGKKIGLFWLSSTSKHSHNKSSSRTKHT